MKMEYVLIGILVVAIGIVVWRWKAIKPIIKEKLSMFDPFVDMYYKHPFALSMAGAIALFISLALFSYTEHKNYMIYGVIYDFSKMGLSVVFVSILLSANRFVPVVKKALGEFFTDKPYLDTLKPEELQKLVTIINKSTKNNYKFEDTKRKKESIELARKKAIQDDKAHFIKDSTIIKVIYEEGLEMTVICNEVEMLKDGVFRPTSSIIVKEDEDILLPSMKEILKGNDRFKKHVFKAKITKYDNGVHGTNPTAFNLFDLNPEKLEFTKSEQQIFDRNILRDDEKIKHILLETKGEFSRGETFTYETVTSIPRASIDGNSKPEITFASPAGIRRIIAQSQHFITPNNDGINGGTLTIGGKKAKDDCIPDENIFYKKYEWILYYDEVSTHTNQTVQIKLI